MPPNLALPSVTLCCVDTRYHELALRSLARSCKAIEFGRVLFLTDSVPSSLSPPSNVDIGTIPRIGSMEDYSRLMLKGLARHIDTPHVLVTQWDSYVVHPETWTEEFLACDYIGAVWPDAAEGFRVGNGGFSLRSRRLLDALRDDRFTVDANEDSAIGGTFRPTLEREFGLRFASEALARRFSFETETPGDLTRNPPFGFHGLFNICLVEPSHEIAKFAELLPESVLRSEFCTFLLMNCMIFKQWTAAVALGSRMLESDPGNARVAEIVAEARKA